MIQNRDMIFLEDQMVEDINYDAFPQSSTTGLINLDLIPSMMVYGEGELCKKIMVVMLAMKLLLPMIVIVKWGSKLLMSHNMHHKFGHLRESGNL